MKSILDVGSGAGQLAKHLLKYGDPDAQITCIDLSQPMLRRARNRLKSCDPAYRHRRSVDPAIRRRVVRRRDLRLRARASARSAGGLCGARARDATRRADVPAHDGRQFLRRMDEPLWCCRTYNRQELMRLCESLGLHWKNELWFTGLHRAMRAGGICVEIEKQ